MSDDIKDNNGGDKSFASKLRFASMNAAKLGLQNSLLKPNLYNPVVSIPDSTAVTEQSGAGNVEPKKFEDVEVEMCPEIEIPDIHSNVDDTKVDFKSASISGKKEPFSIIHKRVKHDEEDMRETQNKKCKKTLIFNQTTKTGSPPSLCDPQVLLPSTKVVDSDCLKDSSTTKNRIRKSNNNFDETLQVSERFCVGIKEIGCIAKTVFMETNKDIETLLLFDLEVKICSNYNEALKRQRQQLSNRFHTNFEISLRLGSKGIRKDRVGQALNSLSCINLNCYPDARDMHTILFTITQITEDRVVFNRSMDFLYQVLAMHPSGSPSMRKYYWSMMSLNFNEGNRWEDISRLLQRMLSSKDGSYISSLEPYDTPTVDERSYAILCFLINVIMEDLHCWISVTVSPADVLSGKKDIPIIAKLFWNQPGDRIGHVNDACRELIKIHLLALERNHSGCLSATKPLIKMLAAVTKLRELQLPLQMCLPGDLMEKLAIEIAALTVDSTVIGNLFFSSFGSSELDLLISLALFSLLPPNNYVFDKSNITLHNITTLDFILRYCQDISIPATQKLCILNALYRYMEIFCLNKTWIFLEEKGNFGMIPFVKQICNNCIPSYDHSVFSEPFPLSRFFDDMKQVRCMITSKL